MSVHLGEPEPERDTTLRTDVTRTSPKPSSSTVVASGSKLPDSVHDQKVPDQKGTAQILQAVEKAMALIKAATDGIASGDGDADAPAVQV
jgi:hypothetical protein